MSWFKLCDRSTFHPKVIAAGNEAYGAWCRAGTWTSYHGEDGRIPREVAHVIAPARVWARLLAVGLLDPTDESFYVIHDFRDFNPTREEVEATREQTKKRCIAAGKASALQRLHQHRVQRDVQQPVEQDVAPVVQSSLNSPLNGGSTSGQQRRQQKFNPDPDPDPLRSSNEITKISGPENPAPVEPARRGRPRGVKAAAPAGYAEVIDAYQRAYVATHNGDKPAISSRTGAAAKSLLGVMPVADAVRTIEAAFEDTWFVSTSSELFDIAARPNRWRGSSKALRFDDPPPSRPRREALTPEDAAANRRAAAEMEELLAGKVLHD